ncbi:DNA ligase [Candidatus Shapirobacteria bacterium CG08_land_8_20_14_0_20_39_18]|uniref:Probable DNA ligase n=1 Tax=Candidatus Shapirobacteria bacterium CG08_land_8_20_14_0_20_39_18 TaxID=1974883 RepID=A0A2M6XD24_9BACT|nr:MAG: DNA ligase [Candidatus Shapirobacteria bacterium CG08_land_8_20_14_0_20_39_18]PJE68089.1 MAG: DNA ligase [Candidatus Shapirobacteria bacterium CG10_big_fil_rev_8_21_14_0_10_38_8]
MKFSDLALFFQQLEQTPSRNSMTEILARLIGEAGLDEIDKVVYLIQGRVAPLYEPLEFGMADRIMIQVLARAFGVPPSVISKQFGKLGDLGVVGEKMESGSLKLFGSEKRELSVTEVYNELYRLAKTSGEGSVDTKVNILSELIGNLDPLSVRYVVRIPLGKMRLGFSDMTVLDALSWFIGKSKEHREEIERAFNVRPDLGFIARVIKDQGIRGLRGVQPEVGVPIMMARAERLSSAKDIIEKIGKCAVEGKFDGFRVAVHKDGSKVRMFSRNMEETTAMFPDLAAAILKQVKAKNVIFEGEAIGYNPQTGEFLPFQETVQRKRKYEIEKTAKEVPLKLMCFDCLYVDGKNLINEPFVERRKWLEKIVNGQGNKGNRGNQGNIMVSKMTIVEEPKELEIIFQDAISRGLEGIMAKKLDGEYQAGARGWNWIKLKRSYQGKLDDEIDAVVMGYDFGQGKRSDFGIGDFLIGVYDQKADTFKTIAKIGTGLTDEEWKNLRQQSAKCKVQSKPERYEVDKAMKCDVWVRPEMVVVIRADEISRSPVHTAGRTEKEPGYALRFPRLVDFRDDKSPEDATSVKEVQEMFELQKK